MRTHNHNYNCFITEGIYKQLTFTFQVLTPSPKRISYRARRSLFPRKRLRDEDHVEDDVVPKRVRLPATTSEICQRLEGEGHLIGDGSKVC